MIAYETDSGRKYDSRTSSSAVGSHEGGYRTFLLSQMARVKLVWSMAWREKVE